MWHDSDKDRFFNEVKMAVMSGATPQEMLQELRQDYGQALDEIKQAAEYTFSHSIKL